MDWRGNTILRGNIFRQMSAQMDVAIFEHLADTIRVGRRHIAGVFQEPWAQPRLGTLHTELIEPVVVIRDQDVKRINNGTIIKYHHRSYEVVNLEPDGTGLTTLVLREVI